MHIRMVCSQVLSPILFRSLVFIIFMLLNVRSTTAVVTGSTSTIIASLAKFGKVVAISLPSINFDRTSFKVEVLYCTKSTLLNNFHSAPASSISISGCDVPSSPSK